MGLNYLTACLALRLLSHPYQCTCEIRKQSENNFLVPIKNISFQMGGGCPGGALPKVTKFSGFFSGSFSYIGPNVNKIHFGIFGGGGGLGGGYDRAHLASPLSSHLNQSTCKIWKQSYKDILCYLEKDEMSADDA